ncbi:CDP-alcohol phosphatidyltransferase family protein [Demequina flava]|uniref:CDP-alcohol phosphatidyltransferase family protein n=1 Tax=Demequina flava TaxID=1095025 RepID=UPI000781695F|nr:CDP-alcohol phosphatidyltransferase family protein [Demequina flava]
MSDSPAPGTAPAPSAAIWTLPNVISFIRILLIGVFGALFFAAQDGWAIVVLVAAGFSDFLDGFLARRWNQVTRLGRLLDPAADRLLTIVVVLGLAVRDIIPWWLVIILLVRDVMVGTALLYGKLRRTRSPQVSYVGKAATFCLYIFLPLAYVAYDRWDGIHAVAIGGAVFAAILYWISGLGYVRDIHTRANQKASMKASKSPTLEPTDDDRKEAP